MKVLFIISVMGHGRGGHFHSLNHISEKIGHRESIGVITIGPGESPILKSNSFFLKHINFKGTNLISLLNEVNTILQNNRPEIIHCFDYNVYNILKTFIPKSYKLVVNKCGGRNPEYYPIVENLILFSQENYEWFIKQNKYVNTNLKVITARVNRLKEEQVEGYVKDENVFTFIRIARIGKTYEKSILDTIRLFKVVEKELDVKVKLILIGAIQDISVYNSIENEIAENESISLITDDSITKEASRLLYLGDAIISTGRGVMEASSLGKPVLVPASNSKYPILLTEDNVDYFLKYNFSERGKVLENDLNKNIGLINKMVLDKDYYEIKKNFSLDLFNKYFDLEIAVDQYLSFYKNLNIENNSKLKDLVIKLKSFYKFYKNSKHVQ